VLSDNAFRFWFGDPAGIATTLGGYVKRVIALLSVMAVMVTMLAVPAFATQPVEGSPQRGGSSFGSNNCVAYNSALAIHNGTAVRFQDRQAEVKVAQASCNNANQ
jgi:hypothetical protein